MTRVSKKGSSCSHAGFHSGEGRYARDSGELRYVIVCDECGQVLSVIASEPYRPAYDPGGNDEYLRAA